MVMKFKGKLICDYCLDVPGRYRGDVWTQGQPLPPLTTRDKVQIRAQRDTMGFGNSSLAEFEGKWAYVEKGLLVGVDKAVNKCMDKKGLTRGLNRKLRGK